MLVYTTHRLFLVNSHDDGDGHHTKPSLDISELSEIGRRILFFDVKVGPLRPFRQGLSTYRDMSAWREHSLEIFCWLFRHFLSNYSLLTQVTTSTQTAGTWRMSALVWCKSSTSSALSCVPPG